MSNLNIKLKEGVRLRNPVDGAVLDNSVTHVVPNNKFWRRRLKDGDVVKAEAPAVTAEIIEPKAVGTKNVLPNQNKKLQIGG